MFPNSGGQGNKWILLFDVSEPRLHDKGFTVYKITSIVFPKHSPEAVTKIVLWKRFRSISHLHKEIEKLHRNLQLPGECPSFPKAQIFHRFDPEVIEERRQSSLKLLQFAAQHAAIFTSQVFQRFLESSESVWPEMEAPPPVTLKPTSLPLPTLSAPFPTVAKDQTTPSSFRSLSPELQDLDPHRLESNSSPLSTVAPPASCPLVYQESSASSESNLVSESDSPDDAASLLVPPTLPSLSVETPISINTETMPFPSPQLVPLSPFSNTIKPDALQASACQYVFHAAAQIGLAQQHEAQGRYEWAFSCYKTGISTLVSGVQTDPNEARREAVKRKTAAYLQRAEAIFRKHLVQVAPPDTLRQRPSSEEADLRGSKEELRFYKVLGVVGKRHVLVLDERSQECCVIKALLKAPEPSNQRTIVPTNVPNIAPLVKYVDTEDAILLILQYAKGGKLWDLVSPYFALSDTDMNGPEELTSEELITNARQLLKSVDATLNRSQTNAYFDPKQPSNGHLRLDAAFLPLLQRSNSASYIPERILRVWAAELITAVDRLHKWGIICCDLNPESLLLSETGHLRLSYQSQWSAVDRYINPKAVEGLYCAPEVGGVEELAPSCDWWSVGALLFELFTGKALVKDYPSGVPSYFTCDFPNRVSESAQDLITGLLQYFPFERLGSRSGAQEIQSHRFFRDFDWNSVNRSDIH